MALTGSPTVEYSPAILTIQGESLVFDFYAIRSKPIHP